MTQDTTEPMSDDPAEQEELQRIAELNKFGDFVRYLIDHGMDEIQAWRAMRKCLRLLRGGV